MRLDLLIDWKKYLLYLLCSRANDSTTSPEESVVEPAEPAGFVPPYPHHVPYSPWNSHQLPDIQTRQVKSENISAEIDIEVDKSITDIWYMLLHKIIHLALKWA